MAVMGIPGLLVLWALVSLSSPQQQQQQQQGARGGQDGLSPNIVTDEVKFHLDKSSAFQGGNKTKYFWLCLSYEVRRERP